MDMGGWLGGTILDFFPSAIQLACVNCPVFTGENNMGKLEHERCQLLPIADIHVIMVISLCYFT